MRTSRFGSLNSAASVFAVLLLPLMMVLSPQFGVTWDEPRQHQYGEMVYRYFASGFQDRSSFGFKDTYLYGGMFDTICVIASKWISTNVYELRHLVTNVFGWIGIVYAGRLAKQFAGPAAGLLAMLMLALSPRYFGDAMNNPKDIPFAAMTMMATYYLAQGRTAYPYYQWRDALKVTLAIALAVNGRAGGILFLCYLAGLLATFVVLDPERSINRTAATIGRGILIAIASLCLGTAFWPWAQVQPLTRPFEALAALSQFRFDGFVLYRGQLYQLVRESLPWHYPFVYFLITTPVVVLAGLVLTVKTLWSRGPRAVAVLSGWVLFLFPVSYVVVRGSTLYDGVRQLLFAYPPLVVIAAIGWAGLQPTNRGWRLAVASALTIGLAEPLVFQWRNHPNQIVYFSPLVGGPAGVFGRYEMDYWGNSLLQATRWSADVATRTSQPIVISSGDPVDAVREDSRRFKSLSYTDSRSGTAHVHIELLRADRIQALLQAPAVHVVRMADGAPLSVVQAGPRYGDVEARLR